MSAKMLVRWIVALTVILTILAIGVIPARADHGIKPVPPTTEPACLNCHEDLYYLHDTGKWYCVSDASTRQRCVFCHGGDPTALKKEVAHTNRSAYPVINGDTSKCQQCHPQDYAAHVMKFDEVAGINPVVYVAHSYTPAAPAVLELTSKGPSWVEIYLWSLAGVAILFMALGSIALFCKKFRNKQPHG